MSDDNNQILSVPRQPSPAYFDMIARKADLFHEYHGWTRTQVQAGRMTEEHRQRKLTRLWQELLAATELPPLPDIFPC